MARGLVAREIRELGGHPELRHDFLTDNGNVILDVQGLKIFDPAELEYTLNNIVGVVCNGLFAAQAADLVLIATASGVERL